jgi:hypothetical protein
MLAVDPVRRRKLVVGTPKPRIAPPVPARSDVKSFVATAAKLGITLWPWQEIAARYLTALGTGNRRLYREIAIIVARQNGKTELLIPLIVERLLAGKRIMHTAQNRELPRLVHRNLSRILQRHHADEIEAIRRGAGQEEIWLRDTKDHPGGHYRIVAPNEDGARGSTNDLLIVDELRQMNDHNFIAAAKPTLADDAQIVYLSNAGTSTSEVLNALKKRASNDPRLAYLEWSARPELAPDDRAGWLEANPAIGHKAGHLEGLEDDYRAHLLSGTMAVFETEQLCRWVAAMDERLITTADWAQQSFGPPGNPIRPVMAINMDPSGERASAVIAWADAEMIVLDVHDTVGSPIDASLLGPDLMALANANRVSMVAFDPYTDADLARYIRKSKAINGREYASATEKFVRLVAERRLRVNDPEGVLGKDLEWTTRRPAPFHSYMAVKASDEHSVTAAIAAVRAAWLASAPVPTAPARIY